MVGRGRIELLEKIRDSGTLSKAASELNIPYRTAWNMVRRMNRDHSCPLVVLRHGGKDHGNARITGSGSKLILIYRSIESDVGLFFNEKIENHKFCNGE